MSENGRSDTGRLFKALDSVQETVAHINYLLAKRGVREALSEEQVLGAVRQFNNVTGSINAVSNILDGMVPRKVWDLRIRAEGALPETPGEDSMYNEATREGRTD